MSRRTSVIVDQWPLVRLGMAAMLADLGVPVIGSAATAREGMELAALNQAAIVVLGAHELENDEAVKRATRLAHRPKVFALIDRADPGQLARLLAAGVAALLVRTASEDDLRDSLRRALAGERVIATAVVAAVVAELATADGGHQQELLTARERAVLSELAQGRSNREIAAALVVSPDTVKTHLSRIYSKLGVDGRHAALARSVSLGLLG